ncbi:proline-rich transmembrane protein 1-like [Lytechinus variegatus]|uniref:proline-rich transmembrane protein 1-like n=1 Tax=Lytechinus variegatus TaxID=7654 RepID=UPI001BB159A6|nr:proline-rich transmembrane protein 1-like [Lytechinus variegatus]XP_041465978.1 proline-rich transmembrane protein 1-like [Lytechinus variegatus]
MAGVAQTQHEKSAQPPTYQQAPPLATPTNPPQYQPPTEQPSTAHYAAQPSNQAWQAPSSSAPPPTYNAQFIVQQPGTYVYQTHPQAFQASNQQSVTVIQATTAPQDYFSFSLFVMLCCCLPLGIVAIVKSGEVKTKASVGDMAGARMASQDAKRYAWIGCSIGLIMWIVGIICLSIWIAFIVEDCNDGYC